MSQIDNEPNFAAPEDETGAGEREETAADRSERIDSAEIDDLPIESIGSYARIEDLPGEESSGSTDYSPSKT